MSVRWLPRPGDQMVLLSRGGRPLSRWLISECRPDSPGEFTLTVVPPQDKGDDPEPAGP